MIIVIITNQFITNNIRLCGQKFNFYSASLFFMANTSPVAGVTVFQVCCDSKKIVNIVPWRKTITYSVSLVI